MSSSSRSSAPIQLALVGANAPRVLPPLDTVSVAQPLLQEVLTSHLKERTVLQTTLEQERQRQRASLLARRLHRKPLAKPVAASGPVVPPAKSGDCDVVPRAIAGEVVAAALACIGSRFCIGSTQSAFWRGHIASAGDEAAWVSPAQRSRCEGIWQHDFLQPEPEPAEPTYNFPDVDLGLLPVLYEAEHRQWSGAVAFTSDRRFWRDSRGGEAGVWSAGSATSGRWVSPSLCVSLCRTSLAHC